MVDAKDTVESDGALDWHCSRLCVMKAGKELNCFLHLPHRNTSSSSVVQRWRFGKKYLKTLTNRPAVAVYNTHNLHHYILLGILSNCIHWMLPFDFKLFFFHSQQ